ncbi:hypothetical protein GIB67_034061 [Kingdonia uniflora]|uniref:non-specific serine/threonine protein kinase n=1 Tax=Kingdonia uniflora TaxID=39325 RepID=A0A7J7M699_9MAGN|nr:hypothetical protein GIB67_034061 [Kingdonia uniflora]
MEMPGRRSNYSLLNQFPEDHHQPQQSRFVESLSAEKNKAANWDGNVTEHRFQRNLYAPMGLQRQSSDSSFGESSLSGDYYVHTLSMAATTNDPEIFSYLNDGVGGGELMLKGKEAVGGSSSFSKSWAQQTEESYQLQLALALRLSSEATCADDPNFLDPVADESAIRGSNAAPEVLSHRFWVNGCLSYSDKVPDGFYLIHGMDPYVWTICTDLQDNGRIPSIESLRAIHPRNDSPIEAVMIDKHSDPGLGELQNRAMSLSGNCISTKEVVDQLAKLVCNHMGGAASTGEDDLVSRWKDCSEVLKDRLDSIVLPIGNLSVGLCRHRALLFKILADTIDLPCRIARGCKYCRRDDASSCLVRFGVDREYLVDLIGKPGSLCEPDSLLNGPSSILISSPLRLPKFKAVETADSFRLLAKQYFLDCESLNLVFSDTSTGVDVDVKDATDHSVFKQFDRKFVGANKPMLAPPNDLLLPFPQRVAQSNDPVNDTHLLTSCNPSQNIISPPQLTKDHGPLKHIPLNGHRSVQPILALSNARIDMGRDMRFYEGGQVVSSKSNTDLSLDVEDLDIPWSELLLKEKIGAGSFGTVHRADWHGSDVAVKILMEQDFHVVRLNEFLREVALMKRLRHPNIVLFMGAVTQPPNLSIVTEYLSRGSLYRLLHKSGAREILDERRRLSMAYDVAKGMNYLHRRNPPIVHRDLKSPNLLVDKKYTVKVCDFGLSRLKANTFLSSKSAAGTPEWMAPEVLRDEPSDEKSDVYSFGVILWELVTLQQPWSNLTPMQVVAAVGFKKLRPEIPSTTNPQVASLIEICWANETWKRPSFSDIMESLKPMIWPQSPQPVHVDMPRLM